MHVVNPEMNPANYNLKTVLGYCSVINNISRVQSALYWIISMIQHRVLTALGNYLKRNYLQVIKRAKHSIDAS